MEVHKSLGLFLWSFLLLACIAIVTAENAPVNSTEEALDGSTTTTTTEAPKIPCDGKTKVCVEPNQCVKGFIDGNTLSRNYNYVSNRLFFGVKDADVVIPVMCNRSTCLISIIKTNLCNATHVCCEFKAFDSKSADKCAIRNLNTFPRGPLPLNANFAEFPWQAMILRESTKTLLCGGIIIKSNFVLTTGECIAGHKTIDVLTKGGEWKLGSDDEGKDFQLVRLKSITLHPDFNITKTAHNLALLHLERDYKFDQHIQKLCLDETDTSPKADDYCVVTGWGEEALKVHKKDAIENFVNVTIMQNSYCTTNVGARNFNSDVSLCGQATENACNFDFGSALACQVKKGSQDFVLKGIYTHNTGCFVSSKFGSKQPTLIFSKPDLEWIKHITKPMKNGN